MTVDRGFYNEFDETATVVWQIDRMKDEMNGMLTLER